jgi:hypothetical protein
METTVKEKTTTSSKTLSNLALLRKTQKITMPDSPRTTLVDASESKSSVRKVVEYTDYPIWTAGGRPLIRRVEKVLMPNGLYRYPVTYIDMTPSIIND